MPKMEARAEGSCSVSLIPRCYIRFARAAAGVSVSKQQDVLPVRVLTVRDRVLSRLTSVVGSVTRGLGSESGSRAGSHSTNTRWRSAPYGNGENTHRHAATREHHTSGGSCGDLAWSRGRGARGTVTPRLVRRINTSRRIKKPNQSIIHSRTHTLIPSVK